MAILKDLIVNGVSRFLGDIFGSKFIVNGGTSSLFLKADGSLDGTTYCSSSDSRLSNSRPASDVYSWAKASTKPSYNYSEINPLYEKTYTYTCTANDEANGWIYFGNVTPTTSYWTLPVEIEYILEVTGTDNRVNGVYNVYYSINGTTILFKIFNVFLNNDYRPLYNHSLIYYNTEAKFNNKSTYPIKIGARLQSSWSPTSSRTYNIKILKIKNCTFAFPNNIELRGNVYSSSNYTLNLYNGTDVGLQESGDSNTYTSAVSWTSAGTADKTATLSNYTLRQGNYDLLTIIYTNTAASALTLNINGTGAKPIWINGFASSSTNYTLPAGTYIIYYDGTNYLLRTDGVISNNQIIEITYSNLKSLRDNSKLIPGLLYKIIDYLTTTAQENTQSAGHQFDVIVRANDVNVLNENAYATLHSGDTYFSTAGANLAAWELKYCLDNDTIRFAWADSTNGKGVIWWMKDEFNNECSYDFKNIQFKWTSAISRSGIVANVYYYTFSVATKTNDATVTDHSLNGDYCYGNKMREYIDSNKQRLNGNVFRETLASNTCNSNIFGNNCYNNTFGSSCTYNTFGNSCYNNTFGYGCDFNTFGDSCPNNTFGNNCNSNTFGNSCDSNTFLNTCNSNIFEDSCYNNTFESGCSNNKFGRECPENTFGNSCYNNTFGNSCIYNTFGNSCTYNTFGDNCYNNTFGNSCTYNTFGNSCNYIKLGTSSGTKNYCRYIIIESGNKYLYLSCSATTSSSAYFQNVKIAQGVNNTTTYKTITHTTTGDTFQTIYKSANSVEKTV